MTTQADEAPVQHLAQCLNAAHALVSQFPAGTRATVALCKLIPKQQGLLQGVLVAYRAQVLCACVLIMSLCMRVSHLVDHNQVVVLIHNIQRDVLRDGLQGTASQQTCEHMAGVVRLMAAQPHMTAERGMSTHTPSLLLTAAAADCVGRLEALVQPGKLPSPCQACCNPAA